jgi:hypothetical protein
MLPLFDGQQPMPSLEEAIERRTEYHTALIITGVTGRIDVRQHKA